MKNGAFVILVLVVLVQLQWIQVKGQCLVTLQQEHGQVIGNGLTNRTESGEMFCSFLGIPYAQPPVRNLRLEPPETLDLSTNSKVWNFTTRSPICVQNNVFLNATGQEDCLYLNVYAKPVQWRHLHPVIVWIHGGWFHYGSAYSEGANRPDHLVQEDVVVVTINYRLGALGFLYREDDNLIANLGLQDQLEALKWVKKNIVYFGGDPNSVTLMGWSAGSASITYHLQAPASAGLFHGAILLSGASFNPWGYHRNTEDCAKALCEALNISCARGEFKTSLKTIPASVFESLSFGYKTTVSLFGDLYPCFAPTFQKNGHIWKNMVQNEHEKLISVPVFNDVPIILSYTVSEEWYYYRTNRESLQVEWNYTYPCLDKSKSEALREYLISNADEFNNESKRLIVIGTNTYGIKQFADYYTASALSKSFLFRFSHKNATNDVGAFHGDELRYIFIHENNGIPTTPEDVLVRQRLVRYIVNFAKYR